MGGLLILAKASFVGTKCMCPMGGNAYITSNPGNTLVKSEKGFVLVEGAVGTCSYEYHVVCYVTPSQQNVKINNLSVICQGDRTSCGGYVEEGSDIVNVN